MQNKEGFTQGVKQAKEGTKIESGQKEPRTSNGYRVRGKCDVVHRSAVNANWVPYFR